MNSIAKVIILSSCTLGSYYLFGTIVKLQNERSIKYHNKLFNMTDYLNLSLMVLSGFSIITLTIKTIDMLENT